MKIIRFPAPSTNDLSTMSHINISVSKFSGLSTGINAHKFIDDFISYCTLCNIGDTQKVAAFQLHLTDEARLWFDDLPSDGKRSWSDIQTSFITRFVKRNTTNSPDFIIQEQLYHTIRLAPGQSIIQYYTLLKEKARALDKSDSDLLSRFIQGLPSQLAFFVRAGNPTTSEQALTSARNGEAYGYRDGDMTHSPSQTAAASATAIGRTPKDFHSLQCQINELSQKIDQMNLQPQPQNRRPQQRLQCQLCNAFGHGAWACRRGQRLN